jgi:hypothetical protein
VNGLEKKLFRDCILLVEFPCCLTKVCNDLNLVSVDSVGYQWISDAQLDEVLDNCE